MCVGWFSSPACALIYQVAQYVALCSSKGYVIGQTFSEWIEARLADAGDHNELLGDVQDLAGNLVCGSSSPECTCFFSNLDAAVAERLLSQVGSQSTFLKCYKWCI